MVSWEGVNRARFPHPLTRLHRKVNTFVKLHNSPKFSNK